MHLAHPRRLIVGLAFALLGMVGCDDSNDSPDATPTAAATASRTATVAASPTHTATAVPPTATATVVATATPTTGATSLSGLAVLSQAVLSSREDSLGAPPSTWMNAPESDAFPTAFSHADWVLHGAEGRRGTTQEDGTFDIAAIPAGQYSLELSRTLDGNFVSVLVPVTIGDDGGADLVIEIDQGRVRSTTTYGADGETVRQVTGPDGSRIVQHDGRIVELADPYRRYLDPDGDGQFTLPNCSAPLWLCGDTRDCGEDRTCSCTASCPFCDDCGPNVCTTPNQPTPYRCGEDAACAQPGDVCTCVPSCPDCTDCALSVCVPGCAPAAIESIHVVGPQQVVVGQSAWFRAIARLDNGNELDVTYLAQWASSDGTIASIDGWGTLTANALGSVQLAASLGDVTSAPVSLEVVERARLTQLDIHVLDCIVPYGRPEPADVIGAPAIIGDSLPHPYCQNVVRLGREMSLVAFATLADGSFQVVTDQVTWSTQPAAVASVEAGILKALAEGSVTITASLEGITSNGLELRVVSQPTIVQLSIYPEYGYDMPVFFPALPDDPQADASLPCFDCGYFQSALVGDSMRFHATARYDTGEWEDVTATATWSSGTPAVGSIDGSGLFTALAAGETRIQAALGAAVSNPVDLRIVEEATLFDVSIYQEGPDRVVEKGAQAYFRAQGSYDVGFGRDVTQEATWRSSDETIGGFDAAGTFVGRAAGSVEVWAELAGKTSNRLRMQVFATSSLEYCDPNDINRGVWSDAFNRVILESSCREYKAPAVAELRFTVTERERPLGIFDPCLDLYVYRNGVKVRTIREQGCGEPFLAPGAPQQDEAATRYQTRAFWDLKDDAGEVVAPGIYTIYGRFYLYFDPVVQIDVAVAGADGSIPCSVNQCGNGCGYVRTCGDDGAPIACPAICRETCECPQGWGLTAEGNCEVCPKACCGPNEDCIDTLPSCEPERECCPLGETCPNLPACNPDACCPTGAICILPLPSCELECCPPNARCRPEVPPCKVESVPCCPPGAFCGPLALPTCGPPHCCPEGALCGALELPLCDERCCPAGDDSCASSQFPCETCCDPTAGTCLQGMEACEPETPSCCPPGVACTDNLPACPQPDPAEACQRTGCSGQICAAEPMASTCEFLPHYACYRAASCSMQANGTCGWSETEELRRCLEEMRAN